MYMGIGKLNSNKLYHLIFKVLGENENICYFLLDIIEVYTYICIIFTHFSLVTTVFISFEQIIFALYFLFSEHTLIFNKKVTVSSPLFLKHIFRSCYCEAVSIVYLHKVFFS